MRGIFQVAPNFGCLHYSCSARVQGVKVGYVRVFGRGGGVRSTAAHRPRGEMPWLPLSSSDVVKRMPCAAVGARHGLRDTLAGSNGEWLPGVVVPVNVAIASRLPQVLEDLYSATMGDTTWENVEGWDEGSMDLQVGLPRVRYAGLVHACLEHHSTNDSATARPAALGVVGLPVVDVRA